MDSTTFDTIARRLASGSNRRDVVRGLTASAAVAMTGVTPSASGSAKKKDRCLKADALCSSSKQCCPKETGRKCKVAVNAGNSDRTCCGVEGAVCGRKNNAGDDTAPFCCVGHDCVNGRCRRAA